MGDRLRRLVGVVRSTDTVWPRLATSHPQREPANMVLQRTTILPRFARADARR